MRVVITATPGERIAADITKSLMLRYFDEVIEKNGITIIINKNSPKKPNTIVGLKRMSW